MSTEKLWNVFSMKEEFENPVRDKYGRFSFYSSTNRDIFSPVVSQHLHANGLELSYPDKKKFAVCLSHDVDFLTFRKSTYMQSVLLAKSLLKASVKDFKKHNKTKNALHPLYALENTLKVERKFNARSSFYFLALQEGEQDFNYGLEEVKEQIQLVADSGCEIGLHGGHGVSEDKEKLGIQKKRLEKFTASAVSGYRSHFLRFKNPDTWNILEESGFEYDTTLGYSDSIGFRNGMCHPFFGYDVQKAQFKNLVEIPLVVMDVSLFNHMQLDAAGAKKMCAEILNKVEKINGALTFLWHNNNMNGAMGEFYKWFLNLCEEKNAWLTDSSSLVKWYKEKNYLSDIKQGLVKLQSNKS